MPLLTHEPSTRAQSPKPVGPLLIIGHRGAAGEAPENTMAAFELAVRQGADGIEFDVHFSADDVPVVIHDAWLDRTTSGSGRVRDQTFAALRRVDAGSWFNRRFPSRARPRYEGLKIPSVTEALAWARERKCLAFVEIKQPRNQYLGIEGKVLEAVHRAGAAPFTTVISFHSPTLRRVRQLDSRISLGIDFTRPLLAVRRAKALGATTLLPHWAFTSRRLISRAHRAGMRVLVWDLDQPRWMRRKILEGVDGIITNFPARLAEIRARLIDKTAAIGGIDRPTEHSPL